MKRIRVFLASAMVAALLIPAQEANANGHCGMECNLEGFNFCIVTGREHIKCWNIPGGCVSGQVDSCGGGNPIEPVEPA